MFRIGLLTYNELPELTESDKKLIPLLAKKGIIALPVIWEQADPDMFDALIFRSTWDYFTKSEKFFEWIRVLKSKNVLTFNSLEIVRWNAYKFYLKELNEAGFPIIPSVFIAKGDTTDLIDLIQGWEKAVIKPAISAGSYLTTLFEKNQVQTIATTYEKIRKSHDLIIQKFIPDIITKGEISLVYFDKKYSHAVIKTPKEGDFRIQVQFGGTYTMFMPDDGVLAVCSEILSYIKQDLLYARVDGVLIDGSFHLMEVELIEPDLYLDFHHQGHSHFADVIHQYLQDRL